jgi:hypothetical protein
VLILFIHKLTSVDLAPISYATAGAQKLDLSEDLDFYNLLGDNFIKFLKIIEAHTGFSCLDRLNNKQKKMLLSSLKLSELDQNLYDSLHQVSIALSTVIHSKENSIQITTITVEEVLVDERNDLYKAYEREQLQLKNPTINNMPFRKIKSNPLFRRLFGFNRMTFIEMANKNIKSKKILITSSYNSSIVVADINGTLIELRQSKYIKKPWGIRANKNNEIFIGDNYFKHIAVFDSNWKFLRKIGENLSGSYSDLEIDDSTNEIFAASLFDSIILVMDSIEGHLLKQVHILSPAYIRIFNDSLFVLSTDYIFCMNKTTFDTYQTIKLSNADYINGLYIDNNKNIFTTAYEVNDEKIRSKEVNILIVRSHDKHVLKKVNTGLNQVNDIAFNNGIFLFLNDTHVDLFEFGGLSKII